MRPAAEKLVQPGEQRLWFIPRQVSGGRQVTGWGRSRRAALTVGLGLMVVWTAACASAPAKIPPATMRPSAAPTTIAPGVSVSPSELALPPYSVSTSNPLPAGVTAKRVVRDVVIDDLIENAALERRDPGLLAYSDTGDLLQSERQEIATDKSDDLTVLSIRDTITGIQVGSKADPNNPSAQMAIIVKGTETREQRTGSEAVDHSTRHFQVLLWVVWSPTQTRYLLCDTANA